MSSYRTILAMIGLTLTPILASAATATEPSSAAKVQVQSNYGKLPLSFEANLGQTTATVNFLSRGPGYTLFLTPTDAVLRLSKLSAKDAAHTHKTAPSKPAEASVLRMTLEGANPHPQTAAQETLPGKVNYLIGKDSKRWRTGIPTYGKVTYAQVYPGIDLVYYGNQRQLEHDFVVAPGADPKSINLTFQGAKHLTVDGQGNLVLTTEGGQVSLQKPIIYQDIDGVRKLIAGGYALKGNRVSFQLARWDGDKPLVIDPVLAYSTYLGGNEDDTPTALAVDGTGHAYVAGVTTSADLPITAEAFQEILDSGHDRNRPPVDAFVAKLNSTGTALDYLTYLGGNGSDIGNGITIDGTGRAYVTGQTTSTDFPTTAGAYQSTLSGSYAAFVAKLNPTGTALDYSTYLGGYSEGSSIAVDDAGHVYVTGNTYSADSADFPTTAGAFQRAIQAAWSNPNTFVTKLNPTGTALDYSTYLGGGGDDRAWGGITIDDTGHAYVAGWTSSADFPTTPGSFQSALSGGYSGDTFVTKLNPTGTALDYSTLLGGNSYDYVRGIAVDGSGHAYVAGATSSTDFPITAGAFQTNYAGGYRDGFIAKLNPTGTALDYSTYLGGSSENGGVNGIAVDDAGHAYVTGATSSTDFPTTAGAFQKNYAGGPTDGFVAKLNPTGTALDYSTYIGGGGDDIGVDIARDGSGYVYVSGVTYSNNFPITSGVSEQNFGGESDGFVTKLLLGKPTTKEQCKNSGWAGFGFKNQGDCIQFVNTGK